MKKNVLLCIDALRRGKIVAVTDSVDRENEADIIVPAQCVTVEQMAFFIRYTSGIICIPMTSRRLQELGLSRLSSVHPARFGTPFTMPVDYVPDTSTGVSAADRVATVRALIRADVRKEDFGMPGHIFPLMEAEGGLRARQGHTEASLELMRLCNFYEAAVIGELMNDDGTMMRGQTLMSFLEMQNIPLCSIDDILDSII